MRQLHRMHKKLIPLPLLFLGLGLLAPPPGAQPTLQECRCRTQDVRKSEFALAYTPEQFRGRGCVVPSGGRPAMASRAAAHEDAHFQFQQFNRSGKVARNYKVLHGQPGQLAIYRHVEQRGRRFEERVALLNNPGNPGYAFTHVEPGGLLGYINFSWAEGSRAPAGRYVARMVSPQPGLEVQFELKPPGERGPQAVPVKPKKERP